MLTQQFKVKEKYQPKVTIIIPTKDNLRNLKRTIQSIFETAGYPFYMILIESESSDGTKEYTDELQNEYPDIVAVYHTKAEGSIKACNFGISKADSDSHIYLTQDDVYFKQTRRWLADYVAYSAYPDAGVLTSCGLREAGEPYPNIKWVGSWDCFIPNKTLKILGLPLLDEAMPIAEDVDFAYRLNLKELKIISFNDYITIDHHQQRDSPHQPQTEEIKRQAEEYFLQKYNLK